MPVVAARASSCTPFSSSPSPSTPPRTAPVPNGRSTCSYFTRGTAWSPGCWSSRPRGSLSAAAESCTSWIWRVMRIARIELFELALPLVEPFIISGGAVTERRSLIVALHDDEGHVGYGESPPFELPFYSAETLASAIDLLRREPERTRADAVLIADMAYIAPRWPAVYTTLRGLCYAEITVRTAKSDLHSGEFGGAAPNAHEELVRLLDRLKTPDGKIHVPGLYSAVRRPAKAELATWRSLPFKESDFLRHRVQAKALTGLKAYSVLERLWAPPTFEIHGITGGFTGDGAKTVIPAAATAKVSLRLVPDQKLKTVERQLAAAVKRFAPRYVQASVTFLHGADPATVKGAHPAVALLDQAFLAVVGRGTIPARAGGSIPVVPALGRGGAPVILTGIGLPDDRLHAPNEKQIGRAACRGRG